MVSTLSTMPSSQPPFPLCVCACAQMCQIVHVQATGQIGIIGSLRLHCESIKLDHQMWCQDLYPLKYLAVVSVCSPGYPDLKFILPHPS